MHRTCRYTFMGLLARDNTSGIQELSVGGDGNHRNEDEAA